MAVGPFQAFAQPAGDLGVVIVVFVPLEVVRLVSGEEHAVLQVCVDVERSIEAIAAHFRIEHIAIQNEEGTPQVGVPLVQGAAIGADFGMNLPYERVRRQSLLNRWQVAVGNHFGEHGRLVVLLLCPSR